MKGAPHILVVEDDVAVRQTLADVLADEGYEVSTATDGAAALEILRAGPLPALILLDLMMPVLDGEHFRREQAGDPSLAAIPTIVLSAANGGKGIADAMGVEGYLAKPVHLERLLELVQALT